MATSFLQGGSSNNFTLSRGEYKIGFLSTSPKGFKVVTKGKVQADQLEES